MIQHEETNFPGLFFHQVDCFKDRVALRHKDYGIWNRITWTEYGRQVREVAAGLLALGLKPEDRVAILGDNRPEWAICHLAAMTAGGSSAAEEVEYVVGHSESKVLFVENEEQVDKVLQIIDNLKVTRVVVWDPKGLWGFSHERIIFFDEFIEKAREYLHDHPDSLADRLKDIEPDDTAMIIYTSGTTGRPKGAMLSHYNILKLTESFMEVRSTRQTKCSPTFPWPTSTKTSYPCSGPSGMAGR
ncbi:MAG: AMP-binding protein [Deltaproteobacteria bacterium]|nr:AMP-binding protein [Deltaproteobacteria bacterium]